MNVLCFLSGFIVLPCLLASADPEDAGAITILFILPEEAARGEMDLSQQLERAVLMARDSVNKDNSSRYLKGKQLHIIVEPSQCDRQEALNIFHSSLFDSTSEVAIVGTGCSVASEAVAEVSQYYSISMVSYASSSMALDDKGKFPYFFRTVPSDSLVATGMAAIISHFNWTRATIITQDTRSFRLLSEELVRRLESVDVLIVDNVLLPNNLSRVPPGGLFPPDVRIFALNLDPRSTRQVLCEAYYALAWRRYRYVWLMQGWYEDRWWEGKSDLSSEVNCTDGQVLDFLRQQRVLGVNHYPTALNQTQTTISGITAEEFRESGNFTLRAAYHTYDALWALVLALGNSSLLDFDAMNFTNQVNRGLGEEIRDRIEASSFQGVSGRVSFSDGTRVMERLQVFQYREEADLQEDVAVIYIDRNGTGLGAVEILGEVWPGNTTPSDGAPYEAQHYPLLWLMITSNIFTSINIVAAVGCLIFNFIFRNRKLIRLSSPNLNYVIGVGVIVFSISVFFFAYPPLSHPVLDAYCGVRSWFAGIGYTLCFGTINTKMWRVYYIFHNPKPSAKKKPLKDSHLLLFIGIFLLVDVIILTIATSLDTVRLEATIISDRERPSGLDAEGVSVNYEVTLCDSRFKNLWLGVLLGYKVIMQGIGVFLAFKIRKVKIKVLNDSKEIVAILYLTSVVLAIVILITLVFGDYFNVYTGGYAYGIPLSSSVVLAVVFVSKMIRLYKDPTGSNLFTHVNRDAGNTGGLSAIASVDADNQLHTLKRKVKHLEAKITVFEQSDVHGNGKEEGKYNPPPPPNANGKHVQIILNNTEPSSS